MKMKMKMKTKTQMQTGIVFLILLLFLFSSTSASHADLKTKTPRQILFSTRSSNPWSRTTRWASISIPDIPKTTPGDLLPHARNTTGQISEGDPHVILVPENQHIDGRNATIVIPENSPLTGNTTISDVHAQNSETSEPPTYIYSVFKGLIWQDCGGKSNTLSRAVVNVAWLLVLFYLLGTTASDYFSRTLEKLSNAWNLSPAVAGVTLLAIGNGAPDVFSSVAAFTSSDSSGSIGFSCVLGGALFITTVVSGTVALVTETLPKNENVKMGSSDINFMSFVRDAVFLLASSCILTLILIDGKIHLWESASFLGIYAVYAVSVWGSEMLDNRHKGKSAILEPLLSEGLVEKSLMHWKNPSELEYHHLHIHTDVLETELEYLLEGGGNAKPKNYVTLFFKYGIEWPLAIPRLLTIPVIEEERWSRPLAVASCTLAPLFVASIWILQCSDSTQSIFMAVGISGGIGSILGALAFLSTEKTRPPQRFSWIWLAAGFFMSVVWFYIVADQVVASLETLGVLFSINPAILGLTVLAWGNSIGDLVADLALACSGKDGIQIAVSGCYAGPLFNVVVGLGISLVIACYRSSPEPLLFSDDDGSLFYIIGFLIVGLTWALVMVPLKGMKLSKSFGTGLILLYFGFLVTGMCYIMGWTSPK